MQPAEKTPKKRTKKPAKQINMWLAIGIAILVGTAGFVQGVRYSDFFASLGGQPTSGNLNFASVQAVYDKLAKQFDGKLDTNKLIDGAKKGLVDAAGDPYTVYFTEAEAKEFMNSLDGAFSGIGAELGLKNGALVIVSTLDDSPARKSGLLPGDIIAKVNDQDTSGWSIDKAVGQIRGDKGTTVRLSIIRGSSLREHSIVRAELVDPSVKSEILPGNIGYMRISRFADDTSRLARQAAESFKDKNVAGVILDLRGDGGGYLTAAQDVSSLWLDAGQLIVQEKTGDKVQDELTAKGDNILKGMPTVVLIDAGSASASEITAGALHDHNVAKLVGIKTFGKGSVQQIVDVPGGQLKVTVAKWYTPNGKNISKEGIAPDVEVTLSDTDITSGNDLQRAKAIDLLKK